MEAKLRKRLLCRPSTWSILAILAWYLVFAEKQADHSAALRPDAIADSAAPAWQDGGAAQYHSLSLGRRGYHGCKRPTGATPTPSPTSSNDLQEVRDQDTEARRGEGNQAIAMEGLERTTQVLVPQATAAVRQGPSSDRQRNGHSEDSGRGGRAVDAAAGSSWPSCNGHGSPAGVHPEQRSLGGTCWWASVGGPYLGLHEASVCFRAIGGAEPRTADGPVQRTKRLGHDATGFDGADGWLPSAPREPTCWNDGSWEDGWHSWHPSTPGCTAGRDSSPAVFSCGYWTSAGRPFQQIAHGRRDESGGPQFGPRAIGPCRLGATRTGATCTSITGSFGGEAYARCGLGWASPTTSSTPWWRAPQYFAAGRDAANQASRRQACHGAIWGRKVSLGAGRQGRGSWTAAWRGRKPVVLHHRRRQRGQGFRPRYSCLSGAGTPRVKECSTGRRESGTQSARIRTFCRLGGPAGGRASLGKLLLCLLPLGQCDCSGAFLSAVLRITRSQLADQRCSSVCIDFPNRLCLERMDNVVLLPSPFSANCAPHSGPGSVPVPPCLYGRCLPLREPSSVLIRNRPLIGWLYQVLPLFWGLHSGGACPSPSGWLSDRWAFDLGCLPLPLRGFCTASHGSCWDTALRQCSPSWPSLSSMRARCLIGTSVALGYQPSMQFDVDFDLARPSGFSYISSSPSASRSVLDFGYFLCFNVLPQPCVGQAATASAPKSRIGGSGTTASLVTAFTLPGRITSFLDFPFLRGVMPFFRSLAAIYFIALSMFACRAMSICSSRMRQSCKAWTIPALSRVPLAMGFAIHRHRQFLTGSRILKPACILIVCVTRDFCLC